MQIFFVQFFCVFLPHLFWISPASFRSILFLSFIESTFAWNVPLVSLIFLKRSPVFPILLFPSISLHWSLRKAFLSLLAILWNSAFKWEYLSFSPLLFTSPLFTAICKASSERSLVCENHPELAIFKTPKTSHFLQQLLIQNKTNNSLNWAQKNNE